MKEITHSPSYNQGAAVAGVLFIGFCTVFMGKVLIPSLFFLWVSYGLKLCIWAAQRLVFSNEKVKFATGVGLYAGGAAILSAAFSLI